MINLLPLQEKKKLHREYKIRVVIVGLYAMAVLAFFALCFLVPSYILIQSRLHDQKISEEQYMKLYGDSRGSYSSIIESTNKKLSLFGGEVPGSFTQNIFLPLLGNVSSSVLITEIFYTNEKDEKAILEIQGTAKNRDALLGFVHSLEESGRYKDVSIPISNFARGRDIEFSVRAIQILKP